MEIKFDNEKQFEIFISNSCMADFIEIPTVPNNNCHLGNDSEECKKCWKDNVKIIIDD